VTTSADPVPRILIIVSEQAIGEIVAAMLRTAGYECNVLWERKAILRSLKRTEKYDLLFCQVSALEGEEKLLTWALGAGKDMPIVATAGRTPGYIPKVIYERCTFLQAPFEREQLLNIVRETVETRFRNLSPRRTS
jgi:DNA-binding NtrC family response regulator